MFRSMEDFFSNRWNLYGLQTMCGSLIIMTLYQYSTILQLLIIGLYVFIIGFAQRLLGIRFGMLFFEQNQDRIGGLLKEIKKLNERDEDEWFLTCINCRSGVCHGWYVVFCILDVNRCIDWMDGKVMRVNWFFIIVWTVILLMNFTIWYYLIKLIRSIVWV